MYTTNEERSNLYGNAFDEVKFNKDKQWFEKQKNIQDTARPFWEAALRFIPFGIGEAISPAIMAGINKGRSVYQGRLDDYREKNNLPGFDYGFDSQGQFFEHKKRELPDWDSGMTTGQTVAKGFGTAVDGFAQWYTGNVNSEVSRMNNQVNEINTNPASNSIAGITAADFGQGGGGAGATPSYDQSVSVNDNPSSLYSNIGNGSQQGVPQNDLTLGYNKGGRMFFSKGMDEPVLVHGGSVKTSGVDKIALVNTETGQDTGKRVDEGEMLVVSKDVLDSLNEAISKKDKKAVFELMSNQVKQTPSITDDGNEGSRRGGWQDVQLNEGGGRSGGGLADLSNYELAALVKQKGLGGGISGIDEIALEQEIKKRGLKHEGSGASGYGTSYRTAAQNWLNPSLSDASGKIITPDENFDFHNWKNKNETFAIPKTIPNGTIFENSKTVKGNYKHGTGPIVNKDGVWYHIQPDGKGAPLDNALQLKLDKEWLDMQEQQYGTRDKGAYPNIKGGSLPVDLTPEIKKPDNLPIKTALLEPSATGNGKDGSGIKTVESQKFYPPTQVQPEITPGGNSLQFGADYQSNNVGSGGFNWTDLAGYGSDAVGMWMGADGANTKIPKWSRTPEWNELMGRLKLQSMSGFSPEEKANFQLEQDRQYASDISNIYNLAGGSNAIALGFLGRPNMQQLRSNMEWGARDAQMKRNNIDQYGRYVTKDMAYDRMLFGDDYSEAKQKEEAGAKLFNDAKQNMSNRMDYNREYGKGSLYDQLQQEQLDNIRYTNDAKRNYLRNMRDMDWSFQPGGTFSG